MRSDRYAVITGASAGIGKATAGALLERGWHVVGVGRDPFRSTTAEGELTAAARGAGRFTMLRGDLSLMADVRRVAEEVSPLVPRAEALVNNAGAYSGQAHHHD